MAVNPELLEILICPDSHQKVSLVADSEVARINASIAKGGVKRRNGEAETLKIDGGLLREDGKYLYAIRDDIPDMLMDEALDMGTVG